MYAGYIVIMWYEESFEELIEKHVFDIEFSNNQRLQRVIVGRWQVFKSFSGPVEPIMNYATPQKTYGIRSTYGDWKD